MTREQLWPVCCEMKPTADAVDYKILTSQDNTFKEKGLFFLAFMLLCDRSKLKKLCRIITIKKPKGIVHAPNL